MKSVGSYEAKTHLPKLLEEVARGERISITRHGVPIAMLVPAGPASRPDAKALIAAMREFRRGRKLQGESLREMIEEGRRF
jgi:prevent-host-death family protein